MSALLATCHRRARSHHQPPVRLGSDCPAPAARAIRSGEARHDDRRRRGSVSRALRHAQGRDPPSAAATPSTSTTIGWRFVNKLIESTASAWTPCPRPPETWHDDFGIEREAQDRMALASQEKGQRLRLLPAIWRARSCPSPSPECGRSHRREARDEHPAPPPSRHWPSSGRGTP